MKKEFKTLNKKMTEKQVKILKENINKMVESDEQFLFLLFKNKNGTDNITQYSFNMIPEKLVYYFKKAINTGEKLK